MTEKEKQDDLEQFRATIEHINSTSQKITPGEQIKNGIDELQYHLKELSRLFPTLISLSKEIREANQSVLIKGNYTEADRIKAINSISACSCLITDFAESRKHSNALSSLNNKYFKS